MEVTLTIRARDGVRHMTLARDRQTIGRSEGADIQIDDVGLSQLNSSIHRQDDRVWILDENSRNGTYVNGQLVLGQGRPLMDGDQISIGHSTTVQVRIVRPDSMNKLGIALFRPPLPLTVGIVVLVAAMITAVTLGPMVMKRSSAIAKSDYKRRNPEQVTIDQRISVSDDSLEDAVGTGGAGGRSKIESGGPTPIADRSGSRRLYVHMTQTEKNEFVYTQAGNISRMMSNREYVFTDDVLPYIKRYVDAYARRVGNHSSALWGEDLTSLFGRAMRVAPDIIREFNTRGVPKVVGLYIPMIESEYRECLTSPVGAKGLFQFMPDTARGYGVDPVDRCDVKKMAPAAAKYLKDRIAEFGSDAMSVALGIAGYNRSPDSVRRDLNDVVNSENKERSFWTLVANSDKLDRFFQNENIKYVPKFFAAGIVGENPWAFGLEMNPLSTYAGSGAESGGPGGQF